MLTARFHRLRDRSMAVNDWSFAEPVRLSFFKDGVLDPNRPAIEIEAILRVGGGKETSVAGGTDKSWRTRIVAQRAELHIDRTKLSSSIVVRQRDKVRALARQGQPWFEVFVVEDRGGTRLVLQLGEV